MAEKSIKKNYLYNLCYQLVVLLTPLITTPYLSRVLGADGIGIYSYVESIASYFMLFAALGLMLFGQREISYVQDDRTKRTQVFWETLTIQVVSSILALVAYIGFAYTQNSPTLYLVLIFNILAVLVDVTWFYQGLEEFGQIVLRNIVFKIVNIVFVFSCVKHKDDLIIYLLGTSLCSLLGNVSLWLFLHKYIDKPCVRNLHPERHLKTVLSLFFPTVAIQVYTVLDKTMIGVITNSAFENGYYEQAIKISKMVLTVVTALGTVMVPRIGFLFGKGDYDAVRAYMYRAYQFVWFLGIPLCVGLTMVASHFVPWFLGPGFEKVIPLLGILSLLILAIGINNATGIQYLIPTKRQNIFTYTVIAGACANFVLNYFLIANYQSIGAAIASVVAETLIAIIQIYIVRRELNPLKIILCGWHYCIAGCAMGVMLHFVKLSFVPSVVSTIALAIIGVIVYFGILLMMRDFFFIQNMERVVNRFFHKQISSGM